MVYVLYNIHSPNSFWFALKMKIHVVANYIIKISILPTLKYVFVIKSVSFLVFGLIII